jgi:hypothetical protein
MDETSKNIQLQYQGYLKTPLLWEYHDLLGLEQLKLNPQNTTHFDQKIADQMLLGKRVERFVNEELKQQENVQILLENVQIQNQKLTIGEIDCLLKQDDTPIHLEIIFKFYLYDPSIGDAEIDRWIGPNRKDSLVKKLNKLKDKQLPLLYNPFTTSVLSKLAIDAKDILQRVLFKAQLFTPYKDQIELGLLNKNCLKGFYIHVADMKQFSSCKFYIPRKADWLMEVQTNVDWMLYNQFDQSITALISEKRAPLCWIKFPNGLMQKFFVVWWRI